MKVNRYQTLVYNATITGEVKAVVNGNIDLKLDPAFHKLAEAFPEFGGIVHCQNYGRHGDIPTLEGNERIALTGTLALDGSSGITGRFKSLAQPVLLYYPASVVWSPGNPHTSAVNIQYFNRVYTPGSRWNRLLRRAGRGHGLMRFKLIDIVCPAFQKVKGNFTPPPLSSVRAR